MKFSKTVYMTKELLQKYRSIGARSEGWTQITTVIAEDGRRKDTVELLSV